MTTVGENPVGVESVYLCKICFELAPPKHASQLVPEFGRAQPKLAYLFCSNKLEGIGRQPGGKRDKQFDLRGSSDHLWVLEEGGYF